MFLDDANNDNEVDMARYEKAKEEYLVELEAWKAQQNEDPEPLPEHTRKRKKGDEEPLPPKKPRPRMQKEEVSAFLMLSTALKIFLGMSIHVDAIRRAENLYMKYLKSFKEASCIRDYIYAIYYIIVLHISLDIWNKCYEAKSSLGSAFTRSAS